MTASSAYGVRNRRSDVSRRGAKAVLMLAGIGATAFALFGMLFLPGEEAHESFAPDSRAVSTAVFPVKSYERFSAPKTDNGESEEFRLPAAVVPFGKELVILDTGLSRVLKLDADHKVTATFASLDLRQPMAMTTDGTSLYIANSLSSEVLVVDAASGALERHIAVSSRAGEKPPRIIGLTLLPNGGMAVSDGENHVVVYLDQDGKETRRVGAGRRVGGSDGFNVPAALATDRSGNVYVVDTLNNRVVKLSSDGAFLATFGERGSSVGDLSRPKGVAVDDKGRVFVSDAISAAVSVYASDGAFLGIIGREDDDDPTSPGMFRAPAQIWLEGQTLYAADRIAGILIFQLEEGPLKPPAPSDTFPHAGE